MDIIVVLIVVLILWTNSTLFPKPEKKKTVDEKLAEAIKDYLKEGFKVRKDS